MKTCSFFLRLFHSPITRLAFVALIALACSIPTFCGQIHDAACYRDLQKVKTLLENNPKLVFSKDKYGYAPLHWAALAGHKDVADLLLSKRADVNAKSNGRHTPMGFGNYEKKMLLVLLQAYYYTPLHLAVANGHKDIIELLLANNAEINAGDKYGFTSLHWAAQNNSKDMAELLIANKADINAKDKYAITPLHKAAALGHKDMVEFLLAHRAAVNAEDKFGHTPLNCAEGGRHSDVVEMLRQHGGHE
jgi:ankyrin repeat protein